MLGHQASGASGLSASDAAELYSKSLAVFPHSPDTLSNAGLLAAQTDDRRAEALHRRAVALAPRSATALYNLAAHVGGDEAAGLYRRALASDPEHTFAHFNLAMCLEETDELEEARTHYQRAVDSSPDDGSMRSDFASFLWLRLRDARAALPMFQQALLSSGQDDDEVCRQVLRFAEDAEAEAQLEGVADGEAALLRLRREASA